MSLKTKNDKELMTLLHNAINYPDQEKGMAAKRRVYAEWDRRNRLFCGGSNIPITFRDGVLKAFGYGVGDDGITRAAKRHVILDHVLEVPIPPVKDKWYTLEWGQPNSNKRKAKLLTTLKGLINSRESMASYHQPSYSRAISQWKDDLNYIWARCT